MRDQQHPTPEPPQAHRGAHQNRAGQKPFSALHAIFIHADQAGPADGAWQAMPVPVTIIYCQPTGPDREPGVLIWRLSLPLGMIAGFGRRLRPAEQEQINASLYGICSTCGHALEWEDGMSGPSCLWCWEADMHRTDQTERAPDLNPAAPEPPSCPF